MTYRAMFLGMKGFTRLESDRERVVWNTQSKQMYAPGCVEVGQLNQFGVAVTFALPKLSDNVESSLHLLGGSAFFKSALQFAYSDYI